MMMVLALLELPMACRSGPQASHTFCNLPYTNQSHYAKAEAPFRKRKAIALVFIPWD